VDKRQIGLHNNDGGFGDRIDPAIARFFASVLQVSLNDGVGDYLEKKMFVGNFKHSGR
jgi:hypothetical protein